MKTWKDQLSAHSEPHRDQLKAWNVSSDNCCNPQARTPETDRVIENNEPLSLPPLSSPNKDLFKNKENDEINSTCDSLKTPPTSNDTKKFVKVHMIEMSSFLLILILILSLVCNLQPVRSCYFFSPEILRIKGLQKLQSISV